MPDGEGREAETSTALGRCHLPKGGARKETSLSPVSHIHTQESREPFLTMQGSKGIENPAFVPSSPDTPRRASASPSQVEVSTVASRNQNGGSQPRESEEPQKSTEPSPPSSNPPASDEPPGSQLSELEEGPCGWRNFHPQCLQRCNTPQGFLLYYCLLALTQGKVQRQLLGDLADLVVGWGSAWEGEEAGAGELHHWPGF